MIYNLTEEDKRALRENLEPTEEDKQLRRNQEGRWTLDMIASAPAFDDDERAEIHKEFQKELFYEVEWSEDRIEKLRQMVLVAQED